MVVTEEVERALGEPLVLTPYPNGGWTITQGRGGGWETRLIAAYGNKEELVAGLARLLGLMGEGPRNPEL